MIHFFHLEKLLEPKFIKFLNAGLLNTIFGYSTYAALVFIKTPYLAALFAATILGIVFNYFSFGRIVFNGHGGWLVFGKFALAYAVIYGANAFLLNVMVGNLSVNPYLGQVICIPVSVSLSWFLMSYWVYRND